MRRDTQRVPSEQIMLLDASPGQVKSHEFAIDLDFQ